MHHQRNRPERARAELPTLWQHARGRRLAPHWPNHLPHVSVWVVAIIVLAIPALLQIPGISAATPSRGPALLALLLLLQLPPLVVVADRFERSKARHRAERARIRELESRASKAERTVLHDEEKLHELKATLGGMAILHRLLRERRSELGASTERRLERLHETELTRLQRLLSDGDTQPSGPLELSAILGPYVDSLRARGHRVSWEDAHAVAWARADDVAEIVNVLLNNAVCHAPSAEIRVSTRSGPAFVEVVVADNGPGVSPLLAARIFTRGTRSVTSAGQGIGLDRARGLAIALGGRLDLRSSGDSEGATFVLRLPAGPPSTASKDDRCLEHSD
jgi:signal transduction histidine kinase